ncbi:hypothetical protein GIB67_021724 [Kingdonia uniflora]|uniref:Uncharacterized protein n=1 Tax=Kingdonia uniflora TaxID=39325 RepID=A0A7J7LMJ8_9MAGN|nr:hypothetical protein GIB67_021724 [Kingdonia uniflora]
MASGWGITGNKGRCYDFWVDFSECMSHCKLPQDCLLLREDYMECLHHNKEVLNDLSVVCEDACTYQGSCPHLVNTALPSFLS